MSFSLHRAGSMVQSTRKRAAVDRNLCMSTAYGTHPFVNIIAKVIQGKSRVGEEGEHRFPQINLKLAEEM